MVTESDATNWSIFGIKPDACKLKPWSIWLQHAELATVCESDSTLAIYKLAASHLIATDASLLNAAVDVGIATESNHIDVVVIIVGSIDACDDETCVYMEIGRQSSTHYGML